MSQRASSAVGASSAPSSTGASGRAARGKARSRGEGKRKAGAAAAAAKGSSGGAAPSRAAPTSKIRAMTLKPTGLSIGSKVTIAMGLISCLAVVVTGVRSYSIFRASFQESVIENGAKLLDVMSGIGEAYADEFKNCSREIDAATERLASLKTRIDEVNDATEKERLLGEQRRVQRERNECINEKNALHEKFAKLLPNAGGAGTPIVTCTVKFPEASGFGSLYRGDTGSFTQLSEIDELTDGTRVTHGKREGRALLSFERSTTIRGTRADLYLLYSAARLDATASRIQLSVLLAVLVAVVLAAAIGWLLSARITAPIRHLVDDIQEVGSGDLDHRTRVESHDEIGVMARAVDTMTQGLRVAREAEAEHRARERELRVAHDIQHNLLPKEIPEAPGVDIAAFYEASKEVGGDYYDFVRLDEHRLAIVVADVSGKGVPGALVMTMVRALMRMTALENPSTASILTKTNRTVYQDIKRGMFVTAMFAILDLRTRELRVSSAGHNPLVLYRAQSKRSEERNPGGIALGFDPGPIFERTIEEEVIELAPGDRVVLYTDGVIEAMSPEKEEFGDQRFHSLVRRAGAASSEQFNQLLVRELKKHQGDGPQHDDITIVTVSIL